MARGGPETEKRCSEVAGRQQEWQDRESRPGRRREDGRQAGRQDPDGTVRNPPRRWPRQREQQASPPPPG